MPTESSSPINSCEQHQRPPRSSNPFCRTFLRACISRSLIIKSSTGKNDISFLLYPQHDHTFQSLRAQSLIILWHDASHRNCWSVAELNWLPDRRRDTRDPSWLNGFSRTCYEIPFISISYHDRLTPEVIAHLPTLFASLPLLS